MMSVTEHEGIGVGAAKQDLPPIQYFTVHLSLTAEVQKQSFDMRKESSQIPPSSAQIHSIYALQIQ